MQTTSNTFSTRRKTHRWAGTAAAICCGLLPLAVTALSSASAGAEPHCPPEDYPCVDPIPDPENSPPAAGTAQITSRTTTSTAPGSASFTFQLRIPARATSWALQRQLSSGWTTVRSGSSTGTPHYVTTNHTGLTPDGRYCYRLLASNAYGSSTSPTTCAYARDGRRIDVSHVQVRLETADVSDGGTDDYHLRVAVNGPYPTISAEGTWLDHGRNDFERGDVHDYDLLLDRIGEFGDINGLTVENQSDDDWCLKAVSLLVDGKTAYRRYFGTSTCRWLGADSASTRFVVSHDNLRSSSYWDSFEYEPPFDVDQQSDGSWRVTMVYPRSRLEKFIESSVGHATHPNELYWGHSYGRSVEARRVASRVLGVDLDLAASVLGSDPEVDIDFELEASAGVSSAGHPVAEIVLRNLDVDVDYDWWVEVVSLGLVEFAEDYIEGEVESQFPRFEEVISEDVEVDSFTVQATANADLVFTAILR